MLVSIVLDRPLDDAKALVEDPERLISETAILESNQSHPVLDQMVNPDVRDDLPIAEFTAASSSSAPHEEPHKQMTNRIGFSKVILKAAPANVGDPRLVVPGQSPWDTPPSTQLQHEVGFIGLTVLGMIPIISMC